MKTKQRIHEKLESCKKTYKACLHPIDMWEPEMITNQKIYFLKGAITALRWVLSKKDCEDLN